MSPGNTRWFGIDGRAPDPNDVTDTLYRVGTSDYLKTLGVQLVEGRLLDDRDGPDAPRSVVINETLRAEILAAGPPRSAPGCASPIRRGRSSPSSAS